MLNVDSTRKHCGKCDRVLPTSQFSRNRRQRSGLASWCKSCNSKYIRKYKENNRQKITELNSKRYQRKRAQIREEQRLYYQANRETIIAKVRRFQESTREERALYLRRYREQNREKMSEYGRRYRALENRAEGSHTANEIWEMGESQKWLCAYCETPLFGNFHIDHMIPLSRGGRDDWQNLAISCPSCNLRKSARTVEEFWEAMNR